MKYILLLSVLVSASYSQAYSLLDMIRLGESKTSFFQPFAVTIPASEYPYNGDPFIPEGLPTEQVVLEEGDFFVLVDSKNLDSTLTINNVTSSALSLSAVAGPCVITLFPSQSGIVDNVNTNGTLTISYMLSGYTYTVLRKTEVIGEQKSSSPVILPSLSGEQYEVILEVSNDLVEWSPAIPGSVTAGLGARFYRVRLMPSE